jgi:hypothetical protein
MESISLLMDSSLLRQWCFEPQRRQAHEGFLQADGSCPQMALILTDSAAFLCI